MYIYVKSFNLFFFFVDFVRIAAIHEEIATARSLFSTVTHETQTYPVTVSKGRREPIYIVAYECGLVYSES